MSNTENVEIVIRELTDKSKVYAVKTYSADPKASYLLLIDCDSQETAIKLAELLEKNSFGIDVATTFTDRCDRFHNEIR